MADAWALAAGSLGWGCCCAGGGTRGSPDEAAGADSLGDCCCCCGGASGVGAAEPADGGGDRLCPAPALRRFPEPRELRRALLAERGALSSSESSIRLAVGADAAAAGSPVGAEVLTGGDWAAGRRSLRGVRGRGRPRSVLVATAMVAQRPAAAAVTASSAKLSVEGGTAVFAGGTLLIAGGGGLGFGAAAGAWCAGAEAAGGGCL